MQQMNKVLNRLQLSEEQAGANHRTGPEPGDVGQILKQQKATDWIVGIYEVYWGTTWNKYD